MKDVGPLLFFLVSGLFLGFLQLASSRLSGGSATRNSPNASAQQEKAQPTKTFIGFVLQVDGKLVLRDSANNEVYLLDDQEKAKPFDGRAVKVIGVLDAASKIIHIL